MNSLRQFFKGFKKGMHNFGQNIAILINSALLLIVYFVGVGFTSVFAKIVGKHFLELNPKKNSNWVEHKLTKEPIENYFRMF